MDMIVFIVIINIFFTIIEMANVYEIRNETFIIYIVLPKQVNALRHQHLRNLPIYL